MALPILDGNQSATTLSTILSGGEHTPAHTVVSLGSTAIANITSAVSGSVVSISNFPASQTISGTVTPVGVFDPNNTPNSVVIDDFGLKCNYGIQIGYNDIPNDQFRLVSTDTGLPISGTVTVGGFSTVSQGGGAILAGGLRGGLVSALSLDSGSGRLDTKSVAQFSSGGSFVDVSTANALPVAQQGSVTIGSLPAISGTVTVGNSVTIGSLPTLTPQLPRVTFIDGSGSVTTANSAITVFASSTTRSYLLVQVTTGSAFVNVGATATTLNGISLTAGQGYAWETTIPQGAVSLISTTTNSAYVAKQA